MNAFIGNHIRFIVEWGQLLTGSVLVLALLLLILINRRFRYFVPRTWLSWTGSLLLLPAILLSALVFARITVIKPGVAPILARLDALQGNPAPALDFERVPGGVAGSLADFEGQVVLVNLWATWCAPCRSEMPELDRLQKTMRDRGLVVLAVSDEERQKLVDYLEAHPSSFETARVPNFDWVDMGSERPVSFLLDREGIIRGVFTGPWDEAFFAGEVEKYL